MVSKRDSKDDNDEVEEDTLTSVTRSLRGVHNHQIEIYFCSEKISSSKMIEQTFEYILRQLNTWYKIVFLWFGFFV